MLGRVIWLRLRRVPAEAILLGRGAVVATILVLWRWVIVVLAASLNHLLERVADHDELVFLDLRHLLVIGVVLREK
jgi:hypothetical protein